MPDSYERPTGRTPVREVRIGRKEYYFVLPGGNHVRLPRADKVEEPFQRWKNYVAVTGTYELTPKDGARIPITYYGKDKPAAAIDEVVRWFIGEEQDAFFRAERRVVEPAEKPEVVPLPRPKTSEELSNRLSA